MRSAIRSLGRDHYPPAAIAAWSSLPSLYHRWAMSAGGEAIFLAERGGRILGYAGLRRAEVTALFVRPSAARRGIASALLGRVEREARRRGVRRVHVLAARSGEAFYRARGYTGQRAARVPLPGGETLPAVRLARLLGPEVPMRDR
jgi:GNAT superfamily N-acetyltransferase